MPPLIPSPGAPILWVEPFDALRPERWREVEVRGRTDYDIIELEGRRCLRAHSHGGASILLNPVRFDPEKYRWLSWRWRVDRLVAEEALERRHGSDAAARVYVYFETKGLPWQKRSIDYVWSAAQPVGKILESAFSASSKIIVVESGTGSLGKWRLVERNIEKDYQLCFGESPPDVLAIGIMSDTDNTRGEALAYFDDMSVTRAGHPE